MKATNKQFPHYRGKEIQELITLVISENKYKIIPLATIRYRGKSLGNLISLDPTNEDSLSSLPRFNFELFIKEGAVKQIKVRIKIARGLFNQFKLFYIQKTAAEKLVKTSSCIPWNPISQ